MTEQLSVIEIAVPLHLDRTFHYLVPTPLTGKAQSGYRALIPFGNRTVTGYILGAAIVEETSGLKEILGILDSERLWTPEELDFFRWIASYYQHPLGEVLRTALPAGINIRSRKGEPNSAATLTGGKTHRKEPFYLPAGISAQNRKPGAKALEILSVISEIGVISAAELRKRFGTCSPQLKRLTELGLCRIELRELYRDPFRGSDPRRDTPRVLHSHQKLALDAITASLDQHVFKPFLLYGVTGSGKTEVYLQAIAHAVEQGKNALVLVPEIALTPQLTGRFLARFGGGIAILHSGLSEGERYDEWRRIRRGLANIVIGARSAIFAPLENIGIIVVDEEHEGSFKQSDGLRYNARDMALVRGTMNSATVLLGSATPSVTTMHAATAGRLNLLELPERVANRPMPDVELVAAKPGREVLSPLLSTCLAETLAQGQQSILFLNRRGYATFLLCTECSKPLTCPNCSVTLTYHRQRRESLCHYCDYAVPAPGTCPSCGGAKLSELGVGTEKLEQCLKELLPSARVLRMDSDTTTGKGSHERLLARMNDGTADILVGTQMIAKGHDFPEVTLAGVINADAALGMPDFRAAERTFQLLSQVIGRVGRGETPGRVILQAADTAHYAIRGAATHDASGFYAQELDFRQQAGYPPFTFLAAFSISGVKEEIVSEQADTTAQLLAQLKKELKVRVEILGPATSPIYRLRNRFRRQILLKSARRKDLHRLLAVWRQRAHIKSTIRIAVDIDPVDMM